MFQRRQKLSFLTRVGRLFWPRMGWRRTIAYLWHRLQRIPGTPSSIAAGFAVGAGIAMTPLYGTHIVTAALVAWALRANIFASVLGAQVANPWTAPPLWFGAYYVGSWTLGISTAHRPPNFIRMFKGLTESTLKLNWDMFMRDVWPVFWPMMVGSVPMGLAAGLASYFALVPVLEGVHKRRVQRRLDKTHPPGVPLPPAGTDV